MGLSERIKRKVVVGINVNEREGRKNMEKEVRTRVLYDRDKVMVTTTALSDT